MKVLPLKGYKSLGALRAFNVLMLGLKMLPTYMGEDYKEFLDRISQLPDDDQMKMIKEAALFVELGKDEIEAILSFCADKNGAPYEAANLKNLGPKEITEMVVAVCFEISKMKINFITENEKKKSETSQ